MACEDQRTLAGVLFRCGLIVVPDMIEMGELGADAAEIIPHTGENFIDLRRRLFREGGDEIGMRDAMFGPPRPDGARDLREEVTGLLGVETSGNVEQAD